MRPQVWGKESLRLLVNLEEITPKLGPAFLRNTLDEFFSRIPCVSILIYAGPQITPWF